MELNKKNKVSLTTNKGEQKSMRMRVCVMYFIAVNKNYVGYIFQQISYGRMLLVV